jgi:hypothetical protein
VRHPAETLIQQVTTNEQCGTKDYEHNLGRSGGKSLASEHEEQRRTKQHQDAALAMNADYHDRFRRQWRHHYE